MFQFNHPIEGCVMRLRKVPFVPTKHEAGERSEPAECVVSYPNLQYSVYTSRNFFYQKNCAHGEAVQIEKNAKPKNGHCRDFGGFEAREKHMHVCISQNRFFPDISVNF